MRTAFDEKTLFPKYILDYEARVRQENKALLAKLNKENETSISNQKKREKSGSVMWEVFKIITFLLKILVY